MGRQYCVFLFCRGTEQPHQGDMNNSNSPNMFLIHKKYISRTQSDQKIRYNYSATFHPYFNALCTAKRVQFITGGYSPVPKVAVFLCLSNLLRSAPWASTNIFRVHKVALFLCLSNLLRSAPWTSTIICRINWASPSQV